MYRAVSPLGSPSRKPSDAVTRARERERERLPKEDIYDIVCELLV